MAPDDAIWGAQCIGLLCGAFKIAEDCHEGVIVKVLAHARYVRYHLDAERLEFPGIADPRAHHQHGCLQRTTGKNDLAGKIILDAFFGLCPDPYDATGIDEDARCHPMSDDRKIGPRPDVSVE